MELALKKGSNSRNDSKDEIIYNTAKNWELLLWMVPTGFFWSFLLAFVSFYAIGVVGLGTVIVSTAITATRVLDGITDPIGGFIFDKTKGKYGKVRIFMSLGLAIMTACLLLMFFTTHHMPEGLRFVYFVGIYAIYVIGNTFFSIAFQSGNAVITNNPKQRSIQGIIMMSYLSIIMAIVNFWLTNILMARHGGFGSAAVFQEMALVLMGVGIVLVILQMIAISRNDKTENFEKGSTEKHSVKDMFKVIKENRPLQVFVIASVTDRLAMNIASHRVLDIMLFGIIIGNFAFAGHVGIWTVIPNLLLFYVGMKFGRKMGTKKAYVTSMKIAIPLNILMVGFLWFVDPTQIPYTMLSGVGLIWFIIHIFANSARAWTGAFTSPLLPDIMDYEVYRSGKFKPGIIASINTFIEKFIGSFYQTIVGLVLAAIGFTHTMPDIDTALTPALFWATMFLFFGIMIITWIISLIAMKYYELDSEKMKEIQTELKRRQDHQTA